VLAGADRAGAGLAADAEEAAVVQFVVGHLVVADIAPHLLGRPVRQRVELGQGAAFAGEGSVVLDHRDFGTGIGTLVLALAGDPGVQPGEFAPQRADLADAAALLVTIPVKAEQALFAHQGLHRLGLRIHDLDGDAVVLADAVHKAVGLGVEAPGIEGKHLDVLADPIRHVDQHHVLGTAEGDRDIVELLQCVAENVLRRLVGEAGVDIDEIECLAAHSCAPALRSLGVQPSKARTC